MPDATHKPRGFAAMDPARVREIASQGGKAIPANRRTFSTDRTLAAEAGRKGGASPSRKRKGE